MSGRILPFTPLSERQFFDSRFFAAHCCRRGYIDTLRRFFALLACAYQSGVLQLGECVAGGALSRAELFRQLFDRIQDIQAAAVAVAGRVFAAQLLPVCKYAVADDCPS